MTQWLTALSAPPEALGSIPSTHMVAHNYMPSVAGDLSHLLSSTGTRHTWYTYILADKIHIHNIE